LKLMGFPGERYEDREATKTGWTVKATSREKTHYNSYTREFTAWLVPADWVEATWSPQEPELGFTDKSPREVLRIARSCTHPASRNIDRRTLKLQKIKLHKVYERTRTHIPKTKHT